MTVDISPEDISSVDISPPTRLGAYRLEKLLGRGGMGEVYLAWDERLERHVAIKRILSDPPPDKRARTRFRREARAVARLSHPAIVQVFELLEVDDGDDCLVMEYVEGCGLAEWIAKGNLGLAHTLRLAAEIADGLAEAHAKGLIHRDLKPENVRVTVSGRTTPGRATPGRAKILDFGLARLLWGDGFDRESLETAVTRSGALVGTVHAMSPEQASGRAVDHRSDLFALGSLIYEMLSGHAPFRGHNVLDTLRRVTSEQPEPLSKVRPRLPSELVALVESLLAKRPEERPQNARLVTDALERLRSSTFDPMPVCDGQPSEPMRTLPPKESGGVAGEDLPTGEWPAPQAFDPSTETVVRSLLLTDLVDSTRIIESIGDARAAEVWARHDRVARDLLMRHHGLEIDKSNGFLILFERPFDAVAFALAYHHRLVELSSELRLELVARVGIHLGEVRLRSNSPEDISRGAKALEVEGLAKPMAVLLLGLASARQTLLTQSAFDLARRSAMDEEHWDDDLQWLAHGRYSFKEVEEPVEVFEVGVADFAPLATPPNSQKAHRTVSFSEELVLGWRPAAGQPVPLRSHWVLKERLGEGGFGEVWLAEHESGEKRVFKFCFEASRLRALKREVTLFRLLKEALGHRDDIARILDWNFEAAPYFLEAEHTEGGDLASWAEKQGGLEAMPLATRVELVAQVADALAAAHSVGVLHKDIKPENILITYDIEGNPRVRLTDFGVGALVDRSRLGAEGVPALGFTETLEEDISTVGSRRYLAPELLEGKPASVQADLYSLGVVLYQIVVEDFSRALAPGWRREVQDNLLAEDIALLVDGSPRQRPASARPVAERLRALEGRHSARRLAERVERRRRHLRFAAVAGGALLMLASVLLVLAHLARQQAERLQGRAEHARQQTEDLIGFMLGDLQEELQAIGRLDALSNAGNKALEYFDSLEAEDLGTRTLVHHAKALHQMGDVHMSLGDLETALALFEQSLTKVQALAEGSPEDLEFLFELGQSHFWVGSISWRQRELTNALEHLQAYLDISQRLVELQPENAEWLLEASYGHNNVGDVFLERANFGMALEHFGQALELSKRLVDLDGSRTDWRLRLATARLKLGRMQYRQGDLTRPLEQGLEAVALLEVLVVENAKNVRWQRRLVVVHMFVVSIQLNLGELDGSLAHSHSALESVQQLAAGDPNHQEWQGLLAQAHVQHAMVLGFLGRRAEAHHHLRQALEFSAVILESNPDHRLNRHIRVSALVAEARQLNWEGQAVAARRIAQQALELILLNIEQPETIPTDQQLLVDSLLALGNAMVSDGSPGADEIFRRARDVLLDQGSHSPKELWQLASAHLNLGEVEPARRLVHALLGLGYRYPPFVERIESLGWESF